MQKHTFVPNLARMFFCMRFLLNQALYEKFKNQVTAAKKTSKNRSNFRPGRHVFARCDETVKDFRKIFSAMTSRVLYLSENIFATVENHLVFSIIRLNGGLKRPTLRAIISQTVGDTAKVCMECQ